MAAFAICVPWWFYENDRQRPLSEFPRLDDDFKLFPEDLKTIRAKGTMSRTDHLGYINSYLASIQSEIDRRNRMHSEDTSGSPYSYYVRAFAPDPRGSDTYFTYDGTVARTTPLSTEQEHESLSEGLADHIFKETGVRVNPGSFVIKSVEKTT